MSKQSDFQAWLLRARDVNPGSSDQDLTSYYTGKYGSPEGGDMLPAGLDQHSTELAFANVFGTQPDPADEPWEVTKGLKAGVDQTQGLIYGATAALGSAMNSESLKDWGMEGYNSNLEEAAQYRAKIEKIEDIGGVGDFASWGMYQLGNLTPTMATMFLTGGVGGAVGKQLAKKGVANLVEKEAAKSLGKYVAIGQGLGAGTGATALETGGIYADILETTGEDRPGVALAFGTMAGSLDALPIMRIFNKIGIGREAKRSIAKNMTKEKLFPRLLAEAGKQGSFEGLTEGAQTIIEKAAIKYVDEHKHIFTPENWSEIRNAMAAGALMGGVMGPITGLPKKDVLGQVKDKIEQDIQAPDQSGSLASGPLVGPTVPLTEMHRQNQLDIERIVAGDQSQKQLPSRPPGGPIQLTQAEANQRLIEGAMFDAGEIPDTRDLAAIESIDVSTYGQPQRGARGASEDIRYKYSATRERFESTLTDTEEKKLQSLRGNMRGLESSLSKIKNKMSPQYRDISKALVAQKKRIDTFVQDKLGNIDDPTIVQAYEGGIDPGDYDFYNADPINLDLDLTDRAMAQIEAKPVPAEALAGQVERKEQLVAQRSSIQRVLNDAGLDNFTRKRLERDLNNINKQIKGEKATIPAEQFDPDRDDLINFIRQEGGLDTELESDWSGRFADQEAKGRKKIERPGRDAGGLTLDDLTERAYEEGFLQTRDKDELESLLGRSEIGEKVYSNRRSMEAIGYEQLREQIAEQTARRPEPPRREAETAQVDEAVAGERQQEKEAQTEALTAMEEVGESGAFTFDDIKTRATEINASAVERIVDQEKNQAKAAKQLLEIIARAGKKVIPRSIDDVEKDRRQLEQLMDDELREGDRRINNKARDFYRKMMTDDPEKALDAMLHHELTNVKGRRAFAIEQDDATHFVSVDADSLKWINDNMSPDTGDMLLQRVADALVAEFGFNYVYHISGDEFYVLGIKSENDAILKEGMNRVESLLLADKLEVDKTDGNTVTVNGLAATPGYGTSKEVADNELKRNKVERERQGRRAGRGLPPTGTVITDAEGQQVKDNTRPDGRDTGQRPDAPTQGERLTKTPSKEGVSGSGVVGFDEATTEMPLYDDMMINPEYHEQQKGRVATKIKLTPDQYLQSAESWEKKQTGPSIEQETVDRYAEKMQAGELFPTLTLDISKGFLSQEGRHRALAAKAVGIDSVPVLFVEPAKGEAELGDFTELEVPKFLRDIQLTFSEKKTKSNQAQEKQKAVDWVDSLPSVLKETDSISHIKNKSVLITWQDTGIDIPLDIIEKRGGSYLSPFLEDMAFQNSYYEGNRSHIFEGFSSTKKGQAYTPHTKLRIAVNDKTGQAHVTYTETYDPDHAHLAPKAKKTKGVVPEHINITGKALKIDEVYPRPEGAEILYENIDENIEVVNMDTDNFKKVTDQWVKLFQDPTTKRNVNTELKNKPYLTTAEAKAKIDSWKKHAWEQGEGDDKSKNADKIILSFFDFTGEWSQPYVDAGYQVYHFDIQNGFDVMDFSYDYFADMYNMFDGNDIYGILAACPCTDFASSGNRWHKVKDADGRTEASKELVMQTMRTINLFKPRFWVLENPVGRIRRLTGLPVPRLSFQPNNFGHNYTKSTVLYGQFNADLPTANAEPTLGSKMHSQFGGSSIATKNARSETPDGFAYSFFMANNFLDDDPAEYLAWKYPAASGAIKQSIKAGLTPEVVEDIVRENYQDDMEAEDARNELLQAVSDYQKKEKVKTKKVQPTKQAGLDLGSPDNRSKTLDELRTKLKGFKTKELKVAAKKSSLKQAGTRDELVTRLVSARDAFETLRGFETERDVEDAIESGEISKSQVRTWAEATHPLVSKATDVGWGLNLRTVYRWMGKAGLPLPIPPTDAEIMLESEKRRVAHEKKSEAAYPKKKAIKVKVINSLPEADALPDWLAVPAIKRINELRNDLASMGYDADELSFTNYSKYPQYLIKKDTAIVDVLTDAAVASRRLNKVLKGHKNSNPERTVLTLSNLIDTIGLDVDLTTMIDRIPSLAKIRKQKLEEARFPARIIEGMMELDDAIKADPKVEITLEQRALLAKESDYYNDITRDVYFRHNLSNDDIRDISTYNFLRKGEKPTVEKRKAFESASREIGKLSSDLGSYEDRVIKAKGTKKAMKAVAVIENRFLSVDGFEDAITDRYIRAAIKKEKEVIGKKDPQRLSVLNQLLPRPEETAQLATDFIAERAEKKDKEKSMDPYDVNKPPIDGTDDRIESTKGIYKVKKTKVSAATTHVDARVKKSFSSLASQDLRSKVDALAGTAWAKEVQRAVVYRDEIIALATGKISLLKAKAVSASNPKLAKLLQDSGWDGAWEYLNQVDIIGNPSKPTMAVNSSLTNCSPSKDCASYCYACSGRHTYPMSKVKTELIDLLAERDPRKMANAITKNFKSAEKAGIHWRETALRMFDIGDGNDAWRDVIAHLNNNNVRVHVFSKSPAFLEQLDTRNIRLLSIDASNVSLAENNDLPLALVYKTLADLHVIDRYQDRIQVVLPEVSKGGKLIEDALIKPIPKELTPYLCPIDVGKKDVTNWTCLSCDKAENGIGCYRGQVTHRGHFKGVTGVLNNIQRSFDRIDTEALTDEDIETIERQYRANLENLRRARRENDKRRDRDGGTRIDLARSNEEGTSGEAEAAEDRDVRYPSYERDPSNIQSREVDYTWSQSATNDLLHPTGLSVKTTKAQSKDNFNTRYKQVEVDQFNVGIDTVRDASDAGHIIAPLRKHAQESMLAVVLDNKGKVLHVIRHTKGVKDASNVSPVELISAIGATEGATQVWFAHNHPSGVITPSESDQRITAKLLTAAEGSGVDVKGHIIVGSGQTATEMTADGDVVGEFKIKPARRSKTVPITERIVRKRDFNDRTPITSPVMARDVVSNLNTKNGLLLMDGRHNVIGVLSMSPVEMSRLRDGKQVGRILSALDSTNAAAGIVVSDNAPAAENVSNYLSRLDAFRILDAMVHEDQSIYSFAERGMSIGNADSPFYSRRAAPLDAASTKRTSGISRGVAQQAIQAFTKQYKGTSKVNIVYYPTKVAALGEREVTRLKRAGAGAVRGAYYGQTEGEGVPDHTVILIGEDIKDKKEAIAVLRHEVLAHYGINLFAPKDKQALVDYILRSQKNTSMKSIWQEVNQLYPDLTEESKAEEVLAYLAENKPAGVAVIWSKIKSLLVRALRSIGLIDATLPGKAELDNVIDTIVQAIGREGQPYTENLREADEASYSQKIKLDSFKQWFGDSKVVDGEGMPIVVYHGTGVKTNFSEFDPDKKRSGGFNAFGSWFSSNPYYSDMFSKLPGGESGPTYPVYLSIQNPWDTTWEEMRRHFEFKTGKLLSDKSTVEGIRKYLKSSGKDGVIIRNFKGDGPVAQDMYVVLEPTQVKSAVGNVGTFDPDSRNIMYSRAEHDLNAIQSSVAEQAKYFKDKGPRAVKGFIKGKRKLMLNWMTGRQIIDMYSGLFGERGNALERHGEHLQSMEAMREKLMHSSEREVIEPWEELSREEDRALSNVMLDATYYEIHPDRREYLPNINRDKAEKKLTLLQKEITRLQNFLQSTPGQANILKSAELNGYINEVKSIEKALRFEGERKKAFRGLVDTYDDLSPAAKDVYRRTKNAYEKQHKELQRQLIARISRAIQNENVAREQATRIKEMFTQALKHGPYFPMARFGDYYVTALDSNGDYVREHAETQSEQDELAELLGDEGYTNIEVGKVSNTKQQDLEAAPRIAHEVFRLMEENGIESLDLKDDIYQLVMKTMPGMSFAKHSIHRRKTAGFSSDMKRAFSSSILHGSHHIARIAYSDQLADSLGQADKMIKDRNREGFISPINNKTANQAQDVVDMMRERMDRIMNPNGSPWTAAAGNVGFTFYLGASPAAGLVNLTQTALVSYPKLAARFGWKKAGTMLLKAAKDYLDSDFKPTSKDSWKTLVRNENISTQERAFIQEMIDNGTIDVTQSHWIAALSDIDTRYQTELTGRRKKIMQYVSSLFHNAEVMNREVTLLATYRLAKEDASIKDPIKYAQKVTYDTHFDYSSSNRAQYMKNDFVKVMTMFKNYSQHMIHLLISNAYQTYKIGRQVGAKEAWGSEYRRNLTGVLGMHALFAGSLGLPLASFVFQALDAAFGDEDEPYDSEADFQTWAYDTFGPVMGTAVTKGVFNAAGIDMHSRVSLDGLIFRSDDQNLEGRKKASYYLEQAAGPMFGIVANGFQGLQDMGRGETLRGLERIMPKFMRDHAKMLRYVSEGGVLTYSDEAIVDDLNVLELGSQSLGFSPARVSSKYDLRRSLKGIEREYKGRRKQLMNAYYLAVKNKDIVERKRVMDDIRAYNKANADKPFVRITRKQLRQSLKSRRRSAAKTKGGIYMDSRYEPLRDTIYF